MDNIHWNIHGVNRAFEIFNNDNTYMQTNTFNMLLVWSKVFVLFVELFPSTGVLWVTGVRLHISILFNNYLGHFR